MPKFWRSLLAISVVMLLGCLPSSVPVQPTVTLMRLYPDTPQPATRVVIMTQRALESIADANVLPADLTHDAETTLVASGVEGTLIALAATASRAHMTQTAIASAVARSPATPRPTLTAIPMPEIVESSETSPQHPAPFLSVLSVWPLNVSLQQAARNAAISGYKPHTGNQFVLALLQLTCYPDAGRCTIYGDEQLQLVSNTGVIHRRLSPIKPAPGEQSLDVIEFLGGASIRGRVAFEVSKSESNLILIVGGSPIGPYGYITLFTE